MEELIPIVGIVFTFGIPIVAILTHHQRKMAELIHGGQRNQAIDQGLAQELAAMRQALAQQSIAIDNLQSDIRQLQASAAATPLEQRLNS